MILKRAVVVVLVPLALVISGCGSSRNTIIDRGTLPPRAPTTATTAGSPGTATADRIGLLSAAARQRFAVDNSFGGTAISGKLLVVGQITSPSGGQSTSTGTVITQPERDAIAAALAAVTIEWVDEPKPDELLVNGRMPSGIAGVLSLGEPKIEGNHAEVASSFFCGSLCAIGGATGFERQADGTWKSTGPTGQQWIS